MLKKTFISTFILFVTLISCSTTNQELENNAWEQLFNKEYEEALKGFRQLNKETDISKTSILGLAFTQAVLKKDNYISTIKKGFKENTYFYGNLVTGFSINPTDSTTTIQLKALINSTEFKARQNNQILEGEFKDLKPFGVWKLFNQNGKLIREIDSQSFLK